MTAKSRVKVRNIQIVNGTDGSQEYMEGMQLLMGELASLHPGLTHLEVGDPVRSGLLTKIDLGSNRVETANTLYEVVE